MVEKIAIIMGSLTAMLTVFLTYRAAMQKGAVDLVNTKLGGLKDDYESLKKRAAECDAELAATRKLFRDAEQRMQQQIQDLLVQLAVENHKQIRTGGRRTASD